jgi:hypothetical protein
MTDRELMQMALEALKSCWEIGLTSKNWRQVEEAITALRQALEQQPADEPVACQHKRYTVDVNEQTGTCHDCGAEGRMRFVVNDTRPQPAAWVGLSPEEIWEIAYDRDTANGPLTFARAIEAKLREKNT